MNFSQFLGRKLKQVTEQCSKSYKCFKSDTILILWFVLAKTCEILFGIKKTFFRSNMAIRNHSLGGVIYNS